MKEKYIWTGIILIILSGIGNYAFSHSKQLEKPIFLEHFYKRMYDVDAESNIPITLYYLTNKIDPAVIHYVEINGVEAYPVGGNDFFIWSGEEQQVNYEQDFRHYYLMREIIEIPVIMPPKDQPWSINTMDVYFTDGQHVNADIGDVVIDIASQHDNVMDFVMSGSNNHRESEEIMRATQPILIEEINIPSPGKTGKLAMKIDMNQDRLSEWKTLQQGGDFPEWYEENNNRKWDELPGIPLEDVSLPISLQADDWIHMRTKFYGDHTGYFEFGIEIKGSTESGEPFVLESVVNDQPYLNQNDIDKIIAEKGEESSK